MNTPDIEVEIEQNVETGEVLTANGVNLTPDTEWSPEICQIVGEVSIKMGSETSRKLADEIRRIRTSRDTYWKERVRKEVECAHRHTPSEIKFYGCEIITPTPITNEDNLK